MSGPEVRSGDAWQREATTWADRWLAQAGIARTGPVEELRVRPWATVLRMPTSAGVTWLKAAAPETAFEAPLYPLLHQVAPNCLLAPVAVDPARGWMLLPDGGTQLRDAVAGDAVVRAMERVLPRYAELQRAIAAEVEAMLALGMLDARPRAIPARFEEALTASRRYVEAHGSGEDRATLSRLEALREEVESAAAMLAASPVPASIDHNDLHPGNVLVNGAIESARFFDWGDSVVAHPFASLLVALRVMQHQLSCPLDDSRLLRVRDAYLEVWGDLGTRRELIETVELSCHLGKVARSLVWERALGMLSGAEAEEHADAPFGWLSMMLDASHLGDLG